MPRIRKKINLIHNSIYLGDELARFKALCASSQDPRVIATLEKLEEEREEAAEECRRHWLLFENGEEDE